MNKRKKIFILLTIGILILIIGKVFINRSNSVKQIRIELPENYKTSEVKNLCVKANEFRTKGDYDRAISLYREALKFDQSNTRILFDLAGTYSLKKDLTNALFTLDEAIRLDSTNAFFYCNRGLASFHLGNNEKAIADYKKAIQLDSNNYIYFANLALAYNKEENYQSACEALFSAKKLGLDISIDNQLQDIDDDCK